MAPGAKSKFGAPMFEPEVFQKQIYCTEGSTRDIVGTFRHPWQSFGASRSDSARGELCPLAPIATFLYLRDRNQSEKPSEGYKIEAHRFSCQFNALFALWSNWLHNLIVFQVDHAVIHFLVLH